MKAMFATPCYISAVSMNFTTSIYEMAIHTHRFGLDSVFHMHSESLITRSRNKMLIPFLKDESLTHLFWIDSDLAFTPQSVCRLLLADKDVAAGVYPIKSFNWPEGGLPAGTTREQFEDRYTTYPFNPIGHGSEKVRGYADADDFVEVAEAPTGFMCIKRDVILRMLKHYPELNYVPDGPPNNPDAPYHWLLFDCMVDPDTGRYLSEDYAFCRRWRDMGGKVHVDLQCQLMHLGQHAFRGNLAESLRIQGRW